MLPNALRAANDVRFTMVVATASMLVWRMGLSWVLCVQMGMGAVASGTPWSLTGSAALYALWPGSSAVLEKERGEEGGVEKPCREAGAGYVRPAAFPISAHLPVSAGPHMCGPYCVADKILADNHT